LPDGRGHDLRHRGLALASPGFSSLAAHPVVMQLARRALSPRLKLSDVESCRTDADFVRKELEEIYWQVAHPYSEAVEFPGIVDPRVSLTATWILDDLDARNSTWAYAKAPLVDGATSPMLPHLCSQEETQAVAASAQTLTGKPGSLLVFLGPYWLSNMIGAASFWKDYDAQTRYKHLSGQKQQTVGADGGIGADTCRSGVADSEGSFRALTNAQASGSPQEELCTTIVQATYVREFVAPRTSAPDPAALAAVAASDGERSLLELLLLPRDPP
jgi:hypothetical protein